MKKWYRVKQPFGTYSRGDLICPEGLHREQLQAYNRIERHACFVGHHKPSAAEIEAYARSTAPITVTATIKPAPELEPVPEVEAVPTEPEAQAEAPAEAEAAPASELEAETEVEASQKAPKRKGRG